LFYKQLKQSWFDGNWVGYHGTQLTFIALCLYYVLFEEHCPPCMTLCPRAPDSYEGESCVPSIDK